MAHACGVRFCWPDAEAVMVPRGEASPGHVRRARRGCPLIGIESRGVEELRQRAGITPFAILKCGHIEMQKHAEAQIDEALLQMEQGKVAANCGLRLAGLCLFFGAQGSGRERGQGCGLGGQP